MSREERKKYWDNIRKQPDNHKDVEDWLDLLAGKEVPDANPFNKEYALMVRQAFLDSKDKTKEKGDE